MQSNRVLAVVGLFLLPPALGWSQSSARYWSTDIDCTQAKRELPPPAHGGIQLPEATGLEAPQPPERMRDRDYVAELSYVVGTEGRVEPCTIQVLYETDRRYSEAVAQALLRAHWKPAVGPEGPVRLNVRHRFTAPVSTQAEGEVFLFQDLEQPPRLLPGTVLYYPSRTDSAGGNVTAMMVVDSTGTIDPGSIRILGSPSAGYEAAARASWMTQHFRPGRLNNQLVRVLMQQEIRFRPGIVRCPAPLDWNGIALCADSTSTRR